MKYEMIFGNQGLFSVAPTDATAVWVDEDGGNFYYKLDSGGLHSWDGSWHNCVNVTDDICFSAMRRIIAEPKRWTVEDQKAGRLPEVGCNIAGKKTGINTVLFNNGDCIVTTTECYCVEKYTVDEVFEYFSPIETPEEKADRLRSEWCSECTSKYYPRGHKGFPEMIYDALLSGALSVPTKGGE